MRLASAANENVRAFESENTNYDPGEHVTFNLIFYFYNYFTNGSSAAAVCAETTFPLNETQTQTFERVACVLTQKRLT